MGKKYPDTMLPVCEWPTPPQYYVYDEGTGWSIQIFGGTAGAHGILRLRSSSWFALAGPCHECDLAWEKIQYVGNTEKNCQASDYGLNDGLLDAEYTQNRAVDD